MELDNHLRQSHSSQQFPHVGHGPPLKYTATPRQLSLGRETKKKYRRAGKMVLKIRLARFGNRHSPVYNIVLAQAR